MEEIHTFNGNVQIGDMIPGEQNENEKPNAEDQSITIHGAVDGQAKSESVAVAKKELKSLNKQIKDKTEQIAKLTQDLEREAKRKVESDKKFWEKFGARPKYAQAQPSAGAGTGHSFGDKPSDDRTSYLRAPGINGDKAGAAGPGSAPIEFREGFGRGKADLIFYLSMYCIGG